MLQNNKEEIQNSINICKAKLKTILPHLTDEKPCLNITFNKLLIEKAILKDKLKHKNKLSFLSKLARKVSSPEKKLICDYFN